MPIRNQLIANKKLSVPLNLDPPSSDIEMVQERIVLYHLHSHRNGMTTRIFSKFCGRVETYAT